MAITVVGPETGQGTLGERILRSLPEWFGIESAIVQYARDIEGMPTLLAKDDDRVVGFLTVQRHFPTSAEIHVMGILPEFHRRGIGRRLVARFEEILLAEGVRWLQVKTLSPSRENEEYRRTREFYVRLGFEPLEEFKTLWGEANPCLQLVKRLGIPGASQL